MESLGTRPQKFTCLACRMALSRLSTRGFLASRSVLASVATPGWAKEKNGLNGRSSRTLFGKRSGEGRGSGRSQSKVLSQPEVGVFELQGESTVDFFGVLFIHSQVTITHWSSLVGPQELGWASRQLVLVTKAE